MYGAKSPGFRLRLYPGYAPVGHMTLRFAPYSLCRR